MRLRSTARLLLSNRQIKSLVSVVETELREVLFGRTSAEGLVKNDNGDDEKGGRGKAKDMVRIRVERDGWECLIRMSVKEVVALREVLKFGDNDDMGGMELLIRKPRGGGKVREEDVGVVLREEEEEDEEEMRIPDEGEVIKIPGESGEDEKKTQLKYDYKTCVLLKKGVNIEVLKVPKN